MFSFKFVFVELFLYSYSSFYFYLHIITLETKEVISEWSGEDVEVASEGVTEQLTGKRSQGRVNRESVKEVEEESEDEFEVDGGYSAMNTRSVVVIK